MCHFSDPKIRFRKMFDQRDCGTWTHMLELEYRSSEKMFEITNHRFRIIDFLSQICIENTPHPEYILINAMKSRFSNGIRHQSRIDKHVNHQID